MRGMRRQSPNVAVITGDIIGSSRYPRGDRQRVDRMLRAAFREAERRFPGAMHTSAGSAHRDGYGVSWSEPAALCLSAARALQRSGEYGGCREFRVPAVADCSERYPTEDTARASRPLYKSV